MVDSRFVVAEHSNLVGDQQLRRGSFSIWSHTITAQDALVGTAMAAGTLPGVGSVFNAGLAGYYAYQGEYGTAAAFGGAAVASMVGLPGGSEIADGVAAVGEAEAVATPAIEAAAEAEGSATISEYAMAEGPHYSIEVSGGGQSLATEQLITSASYDTTIALNTSTDAIRTWTFALPDPQAAMEYSQSLIGTNTGIYNYRFNSCLSYCGNVLNAGGLGVPMNSSRGTWRFLNPLP